MSSLEINKIVAAMLTTGIVASFSAFVANVIMHPDELKEPVYMVAGAITADEPAETDEPAEDMAAMMASAEETAGQAVAKKCTACHTFDDGGANKIGPNLWNIVNRQIAGGEGFSYSDALEGMSDQSWSYDNLNAFMKKPKDFAPGTKMTFAGIKKMEDRANLILYLRSFSDSPAPLPEAAAAAAPEEEPAAEAEEPAAEAPEEEPAAMAEAEAEQPAAEASEEVTSAVAEAEETAAEASEQVTSAAAEAEETAAEASEQVTTAVSEAEESAAEASEQVTTAVSEAAAPASELVAMMAAADEAAGEKVAKKCKACHTFDQGGANKIGPNLWNMIDRPIAGVEGFKYSNALKGMSGDTWTYDSLDAFLKKPKDFAPGTKMSFPGIKKMEDRASLILYMRNKSDSPAPLPQ